MNRSKGVSSWLRNWQMWRGMHDNKLVRSSYMWLFAIPIAAKLIHRMQALVKEPQELRALILSLDLPFTWQVLFFAALTFSIANLLFRLRCPTPVRDFRDGGEYSESGRGVLQMTDLIEQYGKKRPTTQQFDLGGVALTYDPNGFRIDVSHNGAKLCLTSAQNVAYENRAFLFFAVHGACNRLRPTSFLVVSILYIAGLIAAVWVMTQNILWVFH